MARERSPVSGLVAQRHAAANKRKRAHKAAANVLIRHDPLTAHPGRGILNPWDPGCPDCDREQKLRAEAEQQRRHHSTVTHDLADATEREHTKRTRGQRASAKLRKAKTDQLVQDVLNYCRKHKLDPSRPKAADRIAAGLNKRPRTVSRALKAINKN